MRRIASIAIVLVLTVVAGACADDDDDGGLAGPEPQPTVTVTVTASPDPGGPDDGDTDDGETGDVDAQDPCADPPSGTDLIFVTEPQPGQSVSSPFTVEGCSSTFEANVVWELVDRDGSTLAEGFTMGGTMGEADGFSVEVEYEVSEETIVTLRVYESSAEDGSELHVNSIPLVLQ